jgi:uncharacterized protein (TIGR00369 family)
MNEFNAQMQAILDAQGFSKFLGARITAMESRGVELQLAIADHLKQQHGYVHGGVLSYLADSSLTFAGGMALGPSILTSEFKINYLRPAIGQLLVAKASVLSAGKSQAVCRCDIFCVDQGVQVLCAAAQGTIAVPASSQSKAKLDSAQS